MIDLLEGIPGSGKSYEAVVYHVLPALKNGRKVVTNLPLNVDAFAKLDARYRDLLDIRKAPLPVLGRWDAEAANRNENCFVLGEFEAPEEVQNLGIVPTEFETFEHLGRRRLLRQRALAFLVTSGTSMTTGAAKTISARCTSLMSATSHFPEKSSVKSCSRLTM